MSDKMITIRAKYVARWGERFGLEMFMHECQRRGIDAVTGRKLEGGYRHE